MLRLLFFLCALCVLCGKNSSANPPNLILIYTDDHGWPDIGAQGIYDDLKTPNIDALAASGVRATNGYSTAPQCVPSRAGLLSGRHQNRFGVESNNAPLNGEKGMLAEGGMRVPFLISWPGTIPAAQVYDHPLSSLDVAATILPLAHSGRLPLSFVARSAKNDPGGELDGINLIPFLTGKEEGPPHEILTWRWIAQSAIRMDNWKLLRGGSREYLFDLATDPGETNNLLAANPEIAENLRARLTSWSSELTPPGLETGAMSTTWEDYYDFYLDGKPAPAQRAKSVSRDEPGTFQGWVLRNATAGKTSIRSIELLSSGGKSIESWTFNQ